MIVNPKNENDNKCFRYCILAYCYMKTDRNYEHPERISELQSLSNSLVNEYH